ncbi:MAG: hypothetical protein OXE86_07960, partial [Alphaproteobacteria bacterium]|nr:hypothetical protein [Alphaproteobacteria bacterium]
LPGPRRSRGKYSTTSACGWRVPSSDTLLYLECQYIQTGTLGHGWNFGLTAEDGFDDGKQQIEPGRRNPTRAFFEK